MSQKRALEYLEKEKYWQRQIDRLASSGLKQSEFCRKQHLNPNKLSWWKRKLAAKNPTGLQNDLAIEVAEPSLFVPVEIQSPARASTASLPVAEIELSTRIVRVYAGINRHALYEVLAALREHTF